ncbi:hypothetical protein JCM3765_001172 [Sporobolomyces pararoseus]
MPSRHDLSPLPPSSSFSQSTPALSQRPPYSHNASSSSPPNDLIATPSDRYDTSRNGVLKQGANQRRSVRIRSSSGGNFDSSPQIGFGQTHSYLDEKPTIDEISETVDFSHPSSAAANARLRGGGGGGNRTSTQQPTPYEHYPHSGLKSHQYEPSHQYQHHEVPSQPPLSSTSALPPFPSQRQQQIARSNSSTSLSYPLSIDTNRYDASIPNQAITPSTSTFPYSVQAPVARTPNASSALQRASFDAAQAEQSSSARTIRSRNSFEDVMQRSAKRQSRGNDVLTSQVMQWAQEDETSSSSEDEGPGLASILAASAQSRRIASSPATRAIPTSASKLLPSPVNFDRLGGGGGGIIHEANRSPSLGQDGGPRRGIMDRFMSDRPNAPVEDRPPSQQLDKEQIAPPGSPPRRANYAQHLLASPIPSKPSPSVLFSPDVAKLLRSELDQLEANEAASGGGNARRPTSPLKNVDRSSDIVVDSSPMQPNSPYASGGASRTRDVFGNGADIEPPNKRARWTHVVSASDNGLVSPTSSSASAPLRAPSFCDSSPPGSEHGSAPSRSQNLAHPASAPDFAYGTAPPSSSPTSSHNSEYVPNRYSRSSPGPSVGSNLSRSNSIASVSGPSTSQASAPAPSRVPKRTPIPPRNSAFDPTYGQQDPDKKPTWSYAALIGQAIFSADDKKMSLADIYSFIMRCYPYYKKQDAGWQNSIRHNLSLNECFVKTARGVNNPGKGSLWAIVPGCEEQFADGGFVKRGGAGGSRKSRGKAAQQANNAAPAEAKPTGRGQSARRNRNPSPAVSVNSSRSDSISVHGGGGGSGRAPPSTLMIPDNDNMPPPHRDYSPASISVDSETPLSPPPQMPLSASVLEFSIPPPPLVPRAASAASMRQPPYRQEEPRFTLPTLQRPSMSSIRSYSTADLGEAMEEPVRARFDQPMMVRTTSAPVLPTTAPSVASSTEEKGSNEEGVSPSFSRTSLAQLREPLVSVTMSPPTSVYHRLAGPYQPMYGASSLQNRRALALLASPEAAGIMPAAHPFDRGHSLLTSASQGSPRAPPVSFLPSPQIFPGSASKRTRTESDKEDRGYAGLLSPSTLVHTQSPISSVRGGPRVPMSPTQPSVEKLEPIPDPEKKPRAIGTRLLPAVNALVDASHDPFRSPPRTARTRSPSARGFTTIGPLQAALNTPGKRPLGFSPSLSGGNWSSWNDTYNSSIDTDLDHFNRDNMVNARSPWPSPAARLSNW